VQNLLIEDQSPIVDGFPVRQIIIWHRAGGINFNDRYFLPNYEVIYMIAKREFELLPGANRFGCVWQIHQETDNDHPCPFPIELPHRIIQSTSARTVLDPFCGSGTTAVAAKMLGRDYIGIDSSQQYVDMAEERLIRIGRKCG
jgi:modification methylase